jgi:hypothetical protein
MYSKKSYWNLRFIKKHKNFTKIKSYNNIQKIVNKIQENKNAKF